MAAAESNVKPKRAQSASCPPSTRRDGWVLPPSLSRPAAGTEAQPLRVKVGDRTRLRHTRGHVRGQDLRRGDELLGDVVGRGPGDDESLDDRRAHLRVMDRGPAQRLAEPERRAELVAPQGCLLAGLRPSLTYAIPQTLLSAASWCWWLSRSSVARGLDAVGVQGGEHRDRDDASGHHRGACDPVLTRHVRRGRRGEPLVGRAPRHRRSGAVGRVA